MSEESRNDGTIRLLFEMSREDNPPLYDDLVRFAKGSKRVNRLRLLAHEGLRAVSAPAQACAVAMADLGQAAAPSQGMSAFSFGSGEVTDAVFADPVGEGP